MQCSAWKERENELLKVEEKYGQEHKRYRQVLCEIIEKAIVNYIKDNDIQKVLIIQDGELYTLGLDPIHFRLTYMGENQLIVNDSIPLIWLTIGTKEEYAVNEYCYYKTETEKGRLIKIEEVLWLKQHGDADEVVDDIINNSATMDKPLVPKRAM